MSRGASPFAMNDTERAGWLADKLHNGGDYGKEAASLLLVQAMKLDALRHELAMVNNEFGSQTADWPEAYRRVAEVKERAGRYWLDNEAMREACAAALADLTSVRDISQVMSARATLEAALRSK